MTDHAILGTSAASPGTDQVLPFSVEPLDIRGRFVRLGALVDRILTQHDYPEPVGRLLAETLVLTVLVGSSLKFDGKFIVQTKTDGPVPLVVAEFRTPGAVRGYASFDAAAIEEAIEQQRDQPADLLGKGVLALTIDQGPHTQRYQGIVALDNTGLETAARDYFRQSEQIPTEVRLAASRTMTRKEDGGIVEGWSAGGLLSQFLPEAEERMRLRDLPGGDDAPDDPAEEDDAWTEARALTGSASDLELTDSDLSGERLLFRLFNQHGVRVFEPQTIAARCTCSREAVEAVLEGLSPTEIAASVEEGEIVVKCEFCSNTYRFDPSQFGIGATAS